MINDNIIKITIGIILICYTVIALIVTIFSSFIYDDPKSGGIYTNLLGISSFLAFPIAMISLYLFKNYDEYILLPILIIYINISLIYLSFNLVDFFNNGKFTPN